MTQEKNDNSGTAPEKKGKMATLTAFVKKTINTIDSDTAKGSRMRAAYRLAARQPVCGSSSAWAELMMTIPEEIANTGHDGPGLYEKSAYICFMTFAESREHIPGRSLGYAAGLSGSSAARSRLTRIEDASGEEVLAMNIRSLVKMLSKNGSGVDYGLLARDIFNLLQGDEKRVKVMQRWERDFAVGAYSATKENA